MAQYFDLHYLEGEFELFGVSHILALLTLAVLNVLMVIWQRRTKSGKTRTWFRYGLAALLIGQEITLNLWYAYTGQWSVAKSLPLHLCGASLILCAVLLVNKRYALYEVAYFWGFAGATQALLTPDSTYGFPHYRYFQVFISHGAIVIACVYMTFVVGYRPHLRSVWKTFWITNVYTAIIGLFNWLVGANYLFICHKPDTPSLLDVMGPWPWYILALEGVGVFFFLLFYAPWAVVDLRQRRRVRSAAPTS